MDKQQNNERDFWHDGPVVYQIYPRSFYDDRGQGEGTINGIGEKLPYLNGHEKSLGIDVIWLTPFYDSPMVDGGYDVKSYREVNPKFGTMDDFRGLIEKAHNQDIKVMVDFVPNHMSTESEWYKEASSSKDNPKTDWFLFRDAKPDGSMPNNWLSDFRGREVDESGNLQLHARSVWQFEPSRNQYVLCTFSPGQADLNWHNEDVREAMKNEMRFLLDMGVDGFRVDMVPHIGKHPDLIDEPLNPNYDPSHKDPNTALIRKNRDRHPALYTYMNEMVDVLNEYNDRFMVTEDYVDPDNSVNEYMSYFQNVDPKKCAPFCFEGIQLERGAQKYKNFYDKYLGSMGPDFIPSSVLGNHDKPRIVSRVGESAARAAAVTQLSLPGIPFIYYGEELGMENVAIPKHKIDDPFDGRDPQRTPMLWTPDRNAGFSTAKDTWLPISPDYEVKNVEAQLNDPDSFLSLYRSLLKLRRESLALRHGSYDPQDTNNEDVFSFLRTNQNEKLATIVNFSENDTYAKLRSYRQLGRIIISSVVGERQESVNLNRTLLRPNEALIVEL